jgi:hypothetical protein
MKYIRALAMQRKFLEKNRCSIDNILDSWVHGDMNVDYVDKSKNGNKPNEKEAKSEKQNEEKPRENRFISSSIFE